MTAPPVVYLGGHDGATFAAWIEGETLLVVSFTRATDAVGVTELPLPCPAAEVSSIEPCRPSILAGRRLYGRNSLKRRWEQIDLPAAVAAAVAKRARRAALEAEAAKNRRHARPSSGPLTTESLQVRLPQAQP
jgi:hypothetical protein